MRLYRGLSRAYKREEVNPGRLCGTDFTDCPYTALQFARGSRGVVLVLEVPEDTDPEIACGVRLTEELYSLKRNGPRRFMIWGRFDEFLVVEIPAKELRAQIRKKGVVSQPIEYKVDVLRGYIERLKASDALRYWNGEKEESSEERQSESAELVGLGGAPLDTPASH